MKILLIVPYGIEIRLKDLRSPSRQLLIVPYGIEINNTKFKNLFHNLLIVPYGIEIRSIGKTHDDREAF